MKSVEWMPAALQDRLAIAEFIARDDPAASIRIDNLFEASAERIARFPAIGRPGKFPGTRELIIKRNYRLVYRDGESTIWILALFHVRQQWPPAPDDEA